MYIPYIDDKPLNLPDEVNKLLDIHYMSADEKHFIGYIEGVRLFV